MRSREQLATVAEVLATASVVGFGWALGGTVGAALIAGIGINLGADIIQRGSTHLKKKWISGQYGVTNAEIQRALGRALVKALGSIEVRYFQLPEANAQSSDKKRAIRKLFKELKDEALNLFVASADRIVRAEEVNAYLYDQTQAANSKLWDLLEGTKLLYSYYGDHFKNFLRDNLSDELVLWFGNELMTDGPESNRAWRAFQWLLLEGIQEDVQALRVNHEMIRQDLLVLGGIKSKLDELKDTIHRRVPGEPFQQGLEEALRGIKALLEKVAGTSQRLETKVDDLLVRTVRSEEKLDIVVATLRGPPPIRVTENRQTSPNHHQSLLSFHQTNRLSEMVIKQLGQQFGSLDLNEFTSEFAIFETQVQILAKQGLFNYLASRFRSFKSVGHSFSLGSKRARYMLEAGPKVGSTILEVLLFEESQQTQMYSDTHIPLSGWGFYTDIHLSVTQQFSQHVKAIAELLRVVYLSAYTWLAEILLLKLSELESQASVALYSSLRTAFRIVDNEQISESIRFGVAVDGGLYYLVDRQTCVSLVTAISSRRFWSNSSPALSLLNLLGFPLEYENSFSRYAIDQQMHLDFALPRATYGSENPEYLHAEREMVSGDRLSVFVISTETPLKLVANFPTSKKRDIIPVLEANQAHLSVIFERHLDRIIKSTGVLRAKFSAVNWTSAAEVVGGLTGDLIKRANDK
jgi:hypothetical protein